MRLLLQLSSGMTTMGRNPPFDWQKWMAAPSLKRTSATEVGGPAPQRPAATGRQSKTVCWTASEGYRSHGAWRTVSRYPQRYRHSL